MIGRVCPMPGISLIHVLFLWSCVEQRRDPVLKGRYAYRAIHSARKHRTTARHSRRTLYDTESLPSRQSDRALPEKHLYNLRLPKRTTEVRGRILPLVAVPENGTALSSSESPQAHIVHLRPAFPMRISVRSQSESLRKGLPEERDLFRRLAIPAQKVSKSSEWLPDQQKRAL